MVMQREFMHFYKGFWIVLNRVGNSFYIEVRDEDHNLISGGSSASNRRDAKEMAENEVDILLINQALLKA